ncbi:MAG: hypothetical protein IPK53_13395 [bacterium]|nr:hypothetical protein [bacterium]MBK8129847.1 hypothetical protein [bacterium]
MDESVEKKLRALKLKLLMAEKEMQASSGKWKLGALLKAGHTDAMNREVDKLHDRLEKKIATLKSEIAELSGAVDNVANTAPAEKPVAKAAAKKSAVPAAPKKTAAKKK